MKLIITLISLLFLLFSCNDNSTQSNDDNQEIKEGYLQIWTTWSKTQSFPVEVKIWSTNGANMVFNDTLYNYLKPYEQSNCEIPHRDKFIIKLPKGEYGYLANAGGYEWQYSILKIKEGICNELIIDSNPKENFRYGPELGKITFWTTWDKVNSANIQIDIYNQDDEYVYSGFLSQYYNYGTKPDCDEDVYGATSPAILKAGTYTCKARATTSEGTYYWGDTEFTIFSNKCSLFLLR